MEKLRGFEIAKGFENKGINIPVRKTKNAAAYDIEAAEDVIVPVYKPGIKPTLIPTGLKAYCQDDECYLLLSRSGGPKKGLLTFDRSWSGTRRAICNISECKVQACQELKLRIIMDKYSIEVFINDGQQVMTNTFYTDLSADKISFETQGSVIMNVEKYDLIF